MDVHLLSTRRPGEKCIGHQNLASSECRGSGSGKITILHHVANCYQTKNLISLVTVSNLVIFPQPGEDRMKTSYKLAAELLGLVIGASYANSHKPPSHGSNGYDKPPEKPPGKSGYTEVSSPVMQYGIHNKGK